MRTSHLLSGLFGRVNEYRNEYKNKSEVLQDGAKLSTVDTKQGASEATPSQSVIEMD